MAKPKKTQTFVRADPAKPYAIVSVSVEAEVAQELRRIAREHSVGVSSIIEIAYRSLRRKYQSESALLAYLSKHGAERRRDRR